MLTRLSIVTQMIVIKLFDVTQRICRWSIYV